MSQLFSRTVFSATILAALLTIPSFAQTTTAPTRRINLPAFGLAFSETARVHLTNLAANARNGTAASCKGTVTFLNVNGDVIGTPSDFTATTGQTAIASLPFLSLAISTNRATIRAVVTVNITNAPCSLTTSVETHDSNSGITHLHIAGPTDSAFSFTRND